jgi:hypothetical protein
MVPGFSSALCNGKILSSLFFAAPILHVFPFLGLNDVPASFAVLLL